MCKEPINGEEYAPITQELREYIERHPTMMNAVGLVDLLDNIDAIHRSLEDENERLRSASERGDDWPLDADGVPIYIGDMLAEGGANPEKVESLMLDCDGWNVSFGLGWCVVKYHKWHHVKPDTWENIIEDALGSRWAAPDELSQDFIALVARCKALCENTREVEE